MKISQIENTRLNKLGRGLHAMALKKKSIILAQMDEVGLKYRARKF